MPFRAYSDILNNMRLFTGVPVKERDALLSQGHLKHLHTGEMLFNHGDPIKSFYIVCGGSLQMTRELPDGRHLTTDISSAGRTIGKTSILERCHKFHRVSARALEETTVLEFPAKWLSDISNHPVFSLNILAAISDYTKDVELEAEQRTTMTASQRLACFLLRICTLHHLDPRRFELPYSKTLIASRLGMKPETFSRTLATLEEHGIRVANTTVTFENVDLIQQFICEHCSVIGECPSHITLTGLTTVTLL